MLNEVNLGDGSIVHDTADLYKCKVGKNCKIGPFVVIEGDVEIGDNCKIKAHTFIPTGVKVKNNVFIGPGVMFTNDKYPKTIGDWHLLTTVVETGVSIGAGAVILPGITIGANSTVGAGAIVTKNVSPHSTIVTKIP